MIRKKTSDRAFGLQQELEQAELAERQTDKQALLKAKEGEEVAGYTEERDLMNQLLGQVQMARSLAKFTDVVGLSKVAHIKENKLYRALKGKSAVDADGNEIPDVGTWTGFCRVIGSSANKIDEDLLNLRVFGEDAMKGLNRIGAGYRELRKLRKLPDEERELLINGEAVKAGDKEALVELIDEMATKHAREKEALEKKVKDLDGDLVATRRVVEDKNQKITALETEVHRRASMTPDERSKELSKRLDIEVFNAKSAYLGPRSVIKEILEWEEAPRDLSHACAQAIARLRIALDELQSHFQLAPVDLDIDDSWMNETE